MLDLNNVTLSSLLALNVQDCSEVDLLPVDDQQDDDNSIDPGAFVLLFAQIVANTPVDDYKEQITSELAGSIEKQSSIDESKLPIKQELSSLEDNIALTWINSDYYQAELDSENSLSLQLAAANNDLKQFVATDGGAQGEFKVSAQEEFAPLNETFSFDTHINQRLLNTSPISAVPVAETAAIKEVVPQVVNINDFKLEPPKENGQANTPNTQITFHATDENPDKIMQSEPDPMQVKVTGNKEEIQPLINNSMRAVGTVVNLNPTVTQPALQIRSVKINNDSKLSEKPAVEKDKEQTVAVELDSVITSKMNLPTQTPSEQQVPIDVTINQLSQGMTQPFLPEQTEHPIFDSLPKEIAIPTEISEPQWSKQFSDHIVWLSQQDTKTAVIKLHPEDLGPLEVNVKVVENSASVTIVSHSQQVREMIDQSMPKLQEMMAEQGLNLSEMNISSDSRERHFARQDNSSLNNAITEVEEVVNVPVQTKVKHQGVIDYFA
ncbi:MAG: flagellar hook-length control protein FliK [Legionella sp.]|uniref:flagellar hook-length control protein FliK n=1 Tax=Legionella sp. TaxID=459 RepID=UPI0039E3BC48